jgi:eukaryotic-like serine/threonine-protein kinase
VRLQSGSCIGSYEIHSLLGAGGMGEVYRARDTKLNRDVAIKILPNAFANDSDHVARFRREAQILARLNHAHIAQIYSFEDAGPVHALVMELVDGRTLTQHIADGAAPMTATLRIARQIADALVAAHAHGVVHRDLKPANVKQCRDGTVKVLDFGLARIAGDLPGASALTVSGTGATVGGALLGTVPYMSPEQIDGLPVDHRTDLWSFGVLLYEMLAQRKPFDAVPASRTLIQILNEPAPPLNGTPPELRRIVARCLEKDRSARYQTAQELVRDLDACSESLRALDWKHPSGSWPAVVRDWRWAAAVLALVVVAGLATGWWIRRASMQQWARDVAIPQAQVLADRGDYAAAYQLAREAQRHVPEERSLKELWPDVSRTLAVDSDPAGAELMWKPYADVNGVWQRLGATPLPNLTLPAGPVRLRLTKPEYVDLELAASAAAYLVRLTPVADSREVVSIPAGRLNATFGGIGDLNAVIDDFDIDQHEVTNGEFRRFIEAGGYRDRRFWPMQFVESGHVLSWEVAVARFVDSTGRPGPATWEAGGYPEGAENLPVTGVSWYEAVAYVTFAGRSLPTVYHWFRAANTDDSRFLIALSNFGGREALAVGQSQAIGSFGVVDMAGNVREWCLNDATDEQRYILGGGWADPSYMFTRGQTAPPFDRSSTNGFRTAKYSAGRPPPALTAPIVPRATPAYLTTAPVPDSVFGIYRTLYGYQDGPLNARVEAVEESQLWRRETVRFAAGYGNESMVAYLFLPRQRTPPFASVVYVPSDSAFQPRSGESIRPDSYILRSGRAILYPIFKGTFERYAGPAPRDPVAIRDATIAWRKELSRSLDYLRNRQDIDSSKLVYMGTSLGAEVASIFLALEHRFSAAVLLGGGLTPFFGPLPEANAINFLPRVTVPVLMINGKYDSILPVTQAQIPMFERLGTPPAQKRHVIVESGHAVTVPEVRLAVIKEVLDWLEKYVGPT